MLVDTGGPARRMGQEDHGTAPHGVRPRRAQRADDLSRRLVVGLSDHCRDVLDGRPGEDLGRVERSAELGLECGDDVPNVMVLTAEREEVIGHADRTGRQHRLDDPGHQPFCGVPRPDPGSRQGRRSAQAELPGRPRHENVDAGALQQNRGRNGDPEVVLQRALDPDRHERVESELGERLPGIRVEPDDGGDPHQDPPRDHPHRIGRCGGLQRLGPRPVVRDLVRADRAHQRREIGPLTDLGKDLEGLLRIEPEHAGGGPVVGEQRLQRLGALGRGDRVTAPAR